MKIRHTLIASALLTALSAQAQTSITVYGNADIAYNNLVTTASTGIKTEENNIVAGGLSTSNIGFRGDRQITPGLKATFQFEFEVDPTADSGVPKTRAGLIGLSGDYGALTFGRRTTLAKAAIDATDAGDGTNTIGFLGDNARDSRRNDMMTFTTPSMAGFSADLQLSFGSPTKITSATGVISQDGNAEDANSMGLNYANGPLTLKWVNESIKNYSKATTVAGYSVAVPTTMASRKNSAIGATYDFGPAKLFFVDTKMEQGTAASLVRFDTQTLGVRVPVGNFTFLAEAGTGKAQLTNSAIKADLNALQLTAMYALAKDTNVYVAYGSETANHPTFTKKADQKNMQLGMRYKF